MHRIAKYLAACGIASRRDAEKIVLNKKIKVNGKIIVDLAYQVLEQDEVFFNNQLIKIPTSKLWIFNKPRDLIVSHKDELQRDNIFSYIKHQLKTKHIISVGRLDLDSEGLILITNSGDLAHKLEKSDLIRKYKVRAYGFFKKNDLKDLLNGIEIDGIRYKPIKIKQETRPSKSMFMSLYSSSNCWYDVE